MKRLNRPVEMAAVFYTDGSDPKPIKFKHTLPNGVKATIHVDKILETRHTKWGEVRMTEYECESRVMGLDRHYLLKYQGNDSKWILVKF